jgi:two-component system OmpR family sensor kinase/two-component system sensor histidine kinase BaeS
MRGSLFFRLLGAFALVILAVTLVISFLSNRAAVGEFRLYTTRSGQLWAQRLVPFLADYYARTGSWDNVMVTLQAPTGMMAPWGMGQPGGMIGPGMMGEMMGPGMMGGRWNQEGVGNGSWDMWTMMGQRLILADAQGHVVGDTVGKLVGRSLSPQETAEGVPITVNGRQVGTLIIASLDAAGPATPAGQFFGSLNRSILLAGLVAGLIALALGALLFFQLTAPIRQLTVAARAVAAGDLSHRVPVRAQDELGELAQAFNVMAESLARAEEQRRHMVADIAHELRTPLSVIQGNLEAMLDGVLPLDTEQVASLHEETLLLNRLVADLRLLSLAEAGQLKLERKETDLAELIRKIVDLMHPPAQEKGIALEVDLPPSLPHLFVDADRINQVISNLVSNALRYTPAGGAVAVRGATASNQASPAHRLPTVGDQPSVIVTVTDTGPGIAPEDLPHIFDRFYRADKSRARASGGSGLGLAIVKQLVEAHGGRVWAESPVFGRPGAAGHGTRISFTLSAANLPHGCSLSTGGR